MAKGFGGGTKIGTNLKQFNAQYAAQSVNGRSVVIILSDGYDTDPPEMHRRGACPAETARCAHRLAQSAEGLGRLCASGARHGGGIAAPRSFRRGEHARRSCCARTVAERL
jgi:uncharacterized protein with von Willebrand factor type A (vWA) domain